MAHGQNIRGRPAGENGTVLQEAVSQRRLDTLALVRDALARNDLRLAYQPIVAVRNGVKNVAYHEALIRLLDGEGRVIPARDFINQAENSELGRKIDCAALQMGLRALADTPGLHLAINMSARSIGYPAWRQTLDHGMAHDHTIAGRLILEITESSAMMLPEAVTVFMRELQGRGISFALDDFGTGHTSFRYLRDFYFDQLKIDGQFIRGIEANPDNEVLVEALVAISRHFGMLTVAEGVETDAEARFLESAGIDYLQGYAFGAPTLTPPWAPRRSDTLFAAE